MISSLQDFSSSLLHAPSFYPFPISHSTYSFPSVSFSHRRCEPTTRNHYVLHIHHSPRGYTLRPSIYPPHCVKDLTVLSSSVMNETHPSWIPAVYETIYVKFQLDNDDIVWWPGDVESLSVAGSGKHVHASATLVFHDMRGYDRETGWVDFIDENTLITRRSKLDITDAERTSWCDEETLQGRCQGNFFDDAVVCTWPGSRNNSCPENGGTHNNDVIYHLRNKRPRSSRDDVEDRGTCVNVCSND